MVALTILFSGAAKGGERDGGRSPGGGKATPPPAKDKIDHTTCEIVPGHDTVIEIIKVEIISLDSGSRDL